MRMLIFNVVHVLPQLKFGLFFVNGLQKPNAIRPLSFHYVPVFSILLRVLSLQIDSVRNNVGQHGFVLGRAKFQGMPVQRNSFYSLILSETVSPVRLLTVFFDQLRAVRFI